MKLQVQWTIRDQQEGMPKMMYLVTSLDSAIIQMAVMLKTVHKLTLRKRKTNT